MAARETPTAHSIVYRAVVIVKQCDGARGAREKNLTFSRNDTGAVMYPASKVQPFWLRALM